jgi:hypothetical protein
MIGTVSGQSEFQQMNPVNKHTNDLYETYRLTFMAGYLLTKMFTCVDLRTIELLLLQLCRLDTHAKCT